ncbi:amidase [Diplocarpon rosae]|nr:amidase [Diplocarpon rosae]
MLDPHEKVPQIFRDVFKSWKRSGCSEDIACLALDSFKYHEMSRSVLWEAFKSFQILRGSCHGSPQRTAEVQYTGDSRAFHSTKVPGLVVLPSLFPPDIQQTLLTRLLHRDLTNPEHTTNLHLHYEVQYPRSPSSPTGQSFFGNPPDRIAFLPKNSAEHKPLSTEQALRKKIRWMTLGGQYDWTNKKYPDESPPPFPPDIAALIRKIFPDMKPEAAIVNIYSPGDTLSMHRDVSEEVDEGLVSISMGCDAIFIIGLCDKDSALDSRYEVLRLRSGDAVYMTGPSRLAWHGVPSVLPGTCPDYLEEWPGKGFPMWQGWYKLSGGISTTGYTPTQLRKLTMIVDWKALGEKKRDSVNALIPKTWLLTSPLPTATEQRDVTGKYIQQYLSPREIEITETDAVGIVNNTTSGKWKAREVAEAFCHRAALAHQLVNCLHEIFFDAALADAQKLDDHFAEHKKPVGPLHGLPVSLKDQFHVKDVETTMGYVGWIGTFEGKRGTGKEKVHESEMTRELRNLGAILYCKTSVPHTLMAGETVNNIIGYTYNPKNRFLASGGSSGGEGALIGLKGSPVGFGTDIGGSIRIPAAFNGLYGIRPSSGRLPYEGMANSMDGQNSILSVVGPLGTSIGALRLVIKAILSQQPWFHDPLVAEIPWRDEQEKAVLDIVNSKGNGGQLVFGVLPEDSVARPHPPVRRAVDIVTKLVAKLGHKVISWEPPCHMEALGISLKTWQFDGGADIHDALALSGEPMISQVASAYGSLKEQYTASQISAVNVSKRQYQKRYMDYWNSTTSLTGTGRPVDAVITPVAPFAAARPDMYDFGHGQAKAKRIMPGYSVWVNLLDYSAAVLPVTLVDKSVDVVDDGYKPLNGTDEKVWESYDPEIYDGAHVSVQIVGRRFQEEKVLALTEYLGDALRKHVV